MPKLKSEGQHIPDRVRKVFFFFFFFFFLIHTALVNFFQLSTYDFGINDYSSSLKSDTVKEPNSTNPEFSTIYYLTNVNAIGKFFHCWKVCSLFDNSQRFQCLLT